MHETLTLSLTWDEVRPMHHTSMSAEHFSDPEQISRFEIILDADRRPGYSEDEALTLILTDPQIKQGNVLWCESYVEALLTLKMHSGNGYQAHLLWDTAFGGGTRDGQNEPGYAVVTSWRDLSQNEA